MAHSGDWRKQFEHSYSPGAPPPPSVFSPRYLGLDKNFGNCLCPALASILHFPKLIKTSFVFHVSPTPDSILNLWAKRIFEIPSKPVNPRWIGKTHSGTYGRYSFLHGSPCECSRTRSCSRHTEHTPPSAGTADSSKGSLWRRAERHLWERTTDWPKTVGGAGEGKH